jgi:hypothetical protein
MKSAWKAILGALGILALLLVALWLLTPSATVRLKRHFRLTAAEMESDATIRDALLRKLPVGSSREEVLRFLTGAGLGEEGHSRFRESVDPKDPGFSCMFDDHGFPFRLVTEQYWVGLPFDDGKRLKDILVQNSLTGP